MVYVIIIAYTITIDSTRNTGAAVQSRSLCMLFSHTTWARRFVCTINAKENMVLQIYTDNVGPDKGFGVAFR